MLFNSHEFQLAFLPLCLIGFHLLGMYSGRRLAIAWLVLMSLVFYGWWNPLYLILLGGSILGNYLIGRLQAKSVGDGDRGSKGLLGLGIVLNLGLLGWFKYANFVMDSVNAVAGVELYHLEKILLPLAISFFTFQQIAFQVDSYYGTTKRFDFLDYCLFVTFFPQLIAGPIVHHKEMMPQFARHDCRLTGEHLVVGATIFAIGLFKKVIIADTIAQSASPMFAAAEAGNAVTFAEAWGGTLAYTCQLYFDFSGYSDMAIGLARMFGITLPANFDSPLKARSIIDFWSRWHLTLSRFLRDYLFFPLCGKRPGWWRRQLALFFTMVLGGIWHGAGWTFVIWGIMHGLFLSINHSWRALTARWGWKAATGWCSFGYGVFWFLLFNLSLVFFRAESLGAAWEILVGMSGVNGVSLPRSFEPVLGWLSVVGVDFPKGGSGAFPTKAYGQVAVILLIAFLMPTTQQIMRDAKPVLGRTKAPATLAWIRWQPNLLWALAAATLLAIAMANLTNVSEFLYWAF
jgi:D-alanyl-lipoteichoic acid acyltransferase DltB (MBOAT superfamily)